MHSCQQLIADKPMGKLWGLFRTFHDFTGKLQGSGLSGDVKVVCRVGDNPVASYFMLCRVVMEFGKDARCLAVLSNDNKGLADRTLRPTLLLSSNPSAESFQSELEPESKFC